MLSIAKISRLFPPLLAAAFLFLSCPAFAEVDYSVCDGYTRIPVRVTPLFDNPAMDFTLGLGQIQAIAHDPARAMHSPHKGLTLGLTQYQPLMHIDMPVRILKLADGRSCVKVKEADISVGYKNVVIYIPQEVQQGTCGFNEVMGHEMKHVAVNRDVLAQYVPVITANVQGYLDANGFYSGGDPDGAVARLNAALQDIVTRNFQPMVEENSRRQQGVDTIEEYRRVSSSCNGQLARVTNGYRGGR